MPAADGQQLGQSKCDGSFCFPSSGAAAVQLHRKPLSEWEETKPLVSVEFSEHPCLPQDTPWKSSLHGILHALGVGHLTAQLLYTDGSIKSLGMFPQSFSWFWF